MDGTTNLLFLGQDFLAGTVVGVTTNPQTVDPCCLLATCVRFVCGLSAIFPPHSQDCSKSSVFGRETPLSDVTGTSAKWSLMPQGAAGDVLYICIDGTLAVRVQRQPKEQLFFTRQTHPCL